MKIIKLTEKQLDMLKSIFKEGNANRQNHFETELDYEWLGDEYGEPKCSKEVLKKINSQKKIINNLEKKLGINT
jgi:hypothetical protein